jgi:hypothetical protein
MVLGAKSEHPAIFWVAEEVSREDATELNAVLEDTAPDAMHTASSAYFPGRRQPASPNLRHISRAAATDGQRQQRRQDTHPDSGSGISGSESGSSSSRNGGPSLITASAPSVYLRTGNPSSW